MLNELSKMKTAVVLTFDPTAPRVLDSNVGRAKDETKNRIIKILNNSKSSCFILIFLIFETLH